MDSTTRAQPWQTVFCELQEAKKAIKFVADTDTFKKGEAIIIGGQSKWGKKEDGAPNPTAKTLWYDTADDRD